MKVDDLVKDIERINGDERTKQKILELILCRYEGETFYIGASAYQRHRFRQLVDKMTWYTPAEKVAATTARMGISSATAYRWLHELSNGNP